MNAGERIEHMNGYYRDRMKYYDDGGVPDKWASDELIAYVRASLKDLRILEVACGTGLWSGWLAPSAASILATDYNEPGLELARRKVDAGTVVFRQADGYTLEGVGGQFDAGFHADWWSHIPKSKRAAFLRAFHAKLRPGATVVMLDQHYWPTKNRQKEFTDEEGNHIQYRRLRGGARHEIVKNFPTREELHDDLAPFAGRAEYRSWPDCGPFGSGRWSVRYTVKAG